MGRGSKAAPPPPPPSFSPSQIKYGDKVIGETYQDPKTGAIVTNYYPDPEEEARKALLQEKINSISSSLGQTAPELIANYDNTAKTFVNDATSKFMQEYDPALTDLRENVASRFGSLNNSQFFNNLNNLEKNRSSAFADIATKGELLKNSLVSQNEAQKLSELQALGGVLSNDQSAFLNSIQPAMSSSDSMNDFLNSRWMSQLRDFRSNQQSGRNSSNTMGKMLSFLKYFM